MSEPIRVEVVRSGFCESVHLVDVVAVDRSGTVVAFAGEPDRLAAFRSSAKPIQARAMLEAGWKPATQRALAIACASHAGEPPHVEAVRESLAASGLDETALACPPDVPADPAAALPVREPARIYHNCSGKHSGMLAACAAAGWPPEGYLEPDHPAQKAVRDVVERFVGSVDGPLVDGCGAPTFVATLTAFARAFLAVDDGGPEAAAMRAHPFLVCGTGTFDTDFMTAVPNALSKAGAEGLTCVSIDGIGVAAKSRDGFARRARGPAVLHALAELGLIDDAPSHLLAHHLDVPVLGGGAPVGHVRAAGSLARRGV